MPGACILVVMLGILYAIQRYIDYGYGVKREEVEKSIAEQKDKAAKEKKAAIDANPAAFAALRTLRDSEASGKIDYESAKALLSALDSPKPAAVGTAPVTPLEVDVKTGK